MEIPDSITVNTGDQAEVYKNIDDFFGSIINQLEPKPLKRPTELEIRHDNLQKSLYPSIRYNPSDDFCHMLLYQQRVVAVVLETRTDWNYIHFDYFLNLEKLL